MMQRLEAMVEMYDQEVKTARANQGDQYVGHTQGKRPAQGPTGDEGHEEG